MIKVILEYTNYGNIGKLIELDSKELVFGRISSCYIISKT